MGATFGSDYAEEKRKGRNTTSFINLQSTLIISSGTSGKKVGKNRRKCYYNNTYKNSSVAGMEVKGV